MDMDLPAHSALNEALYTARVLQRLEGAVSAATEETAQALDYICFAPLSRRDNAVYWMMVAVHAYTVPLAERLDPEDAAGLLRRYQTAFPKSGWLPAQIELGRTLKKRAAAMR